MGDKFRPLLAFRENPILKALHYPKFVSPKFDGIRAVRPLGDVRLHTRKMKLVPNLNVREKFCHVILDGMDGELIVGAPTDPQVYHRTESIVMSYAPPKPASDVQLHVFDSFKQPDEPYEKRLDRLYATKPTARLMNDIVIVSQKLVRNAEEVLEYEEKMVLLGYEGIMIRDPRGQYKYGRSTLSEETLLKLKRFEDSEAIITGFDEQMENTNEAKESELGYMKRSKKQAGMVGKNTLGAILGHDPKKGWDVRVGMGPGLDDALRAWIWANRKKLLGKWFKYRYQPAGTKDKPRSPRFMGFRDKRDI